MRRIGTLAVLLTFGLTTMSPAQQLTDREGLPDSPASALATRLVELLGDGDGPAFAEFLVEHGTASFVARRSRESDMALARRIGLSSQGLDVWGHRIFPNANPAITELNVLASERLSGRWRQISIIVEGERIAEFGVSWSMPPAQAAPPPLSRQAAIEAIRRYVGAAAANGALSGTVLVAQGDSILLTEAVGEASRSFNVGNQLDTRFNLMSLGKVFTAVLALRDIESGRLGLATRVQPIVGDDWLDPLATAGITVEHLLTHTSGLGTTFTPAFLEASPGRFRELADWQGVIRNEPLAFDPGTGWRYSNAGFIVLGAVLEAIHAAPYDSLLARNILAPASMHATGCFASDEVVSDVAVNYAIDLGADVPTWRDETLLHPARGGPAGGCYSTVKDLFRFVRALHDGVLVQSATLDTAWTDQVPDGVRGSSGLGFQLGASALGTWVGHDGGFVGPNTALHHYPGGDWTIILLSNGSEGVTHAVQTIEWLLGRIGS